MPLTDIIYPRGALTDERRTDLAADPTAEATPVVRDVAGT